MAAARKGQARPGGRAILGIALLAGLAFGLASPATAGATLGAPDVFLKERSIDRPTGDWIPLDGAQLHSVTGYEIGVRLQNSGQPQNGQRILVQVTSVPDGHPSQHYIYSTGTC